MNELKRVGVFTQVVRAQSFSEAARQMGVAKSAVSKQISLLEKEVGIRLFNRSTRKLSLTEAGQIYYQHCKDIVSRAEIALNELRAYQHQPTGNLKVSCPVSFGTLHLIPIINDIHSLYPQLNIEVLLEDRVVNMVEEGIDVAIRVGWLSESNLVAKKLAESPMVVFASPAYLSRAGHPQKPPDLSNHNWIQFTLLPSPTRWTFEKQGKTETIQIKSHLKTNSASAAMAMAVEGQGISALSQFSVQAEIDSGKLVLLLPDYNLDPVGIFAVYPHREHVPPKIRILLDFLEKRCRSAHWNTQA